MNNPSIPDPLSVVGLREISSSVDVLSDREVEVLRLIGKGHGTRQIALELGLSIKTIESHRTYIKEKLNLTTAPEMMRFAVSWVSQQPT